MPGERHSVGNYLFHLWEGNSPLVPQQQVSIHTRPGVDGVAQQLLGRYNRPFEFEAIKFYPGDYITAKVDGVIVTDLTGSDALVVVYNLVNYASLFSIYYLCDQVTELDCIQRPHVVGQGFDYAPATELRLRFRLTPIRIIV